MCTHHMEREKLEGIETLCTCDACPNIMGSTVAVLDIFGRFGPGFLKELQGIFYEKIMVLGEEVNGCGWITTFIFKSNLLT